MTPATSTSIAPLSRKTRGGGVLQRPAGVTAEIATAIDLTPAEIVERAETMPEECMVYLIRNDLRAGDRRLAERLTPRLLERCEATLRGSIRGFPPAAADEIREEVLGRLALALAGPGDQADFFEVRFALALKRLRIDACRRERRRLQGLVVLDDAPESTSPSESAVELAPPAPANQDDRLLIRQALGALTPEERKIVVLHKIHGVPLAGMTAGSNLVGLLGRSERTLRNRLRSAEAKLRDFQRRRPKTHAQEASR